MITAKNRDSLDVLEIKKEAVYNIKTEPAEVHDTTVKDEEKPETSRKMGDSTKNELVTEIKKDYSVEIKDEPVEETSVILNYEDTVKKELNDVDKKPNNKRAREENCSSEQEYESLIMRCQLCDEVGHIADECYRGYRYCRDWEYGDKDCKGILVITNSETGGKRFSCQFGCKGSDGSAFHMLESWSESSGDGKCYGCGESGKCVMNCRWQGLNCKKKACSNMTIVRMSQQHNSNYGKWYWNCLQCSAKKDNGERNRFYWMLIANYEREIATDLTIRKYWSKPYLHGFLENKETSVNFISSRGRDYFRYEGSSNVKCQVCGDKGHRADKCDCAYNVCDYCDSIRVPSSSHTKSNANKVFVKCQNHTCPKEFQWQWKVKMNSQSPNRKCSYCGVPDHDQGQGNCQWKGLKCRKDTCGSIRVLKVSDKEETMGRRYLECKGCSDFQWFWYANFERTVCGNPQDIEYWSANNV